MQQVIMNLIKFSPILLLLSHVSLSRSEEQHQQLFEPRGAPQSSSAVTGNDQDSYMLAYHASRNQGFHPQSNHPPTEHIAEHPNLSIPRGERHYAIVAHNSQSSGERVPMDQERLLLFNQLKREQSEAIARARAIAQSPPVIVSNDISVVRHDPVNYIKQVQTQQVDSVPTHNQIPAQQYVNLQVQNQIPEQHYVNLQAQNQIPAQHYVNLQTQNQIPAQHYVNFQAKNQVPAKHVINIPRQHQIQVQHAVNIPTHRQIPVQHVVNVPSQNQLSSQRHYPTPLVRHYAIPANKNNPAEAERPVQYEVEKKVYVNVERQVPVERYLAVDNRVEGPTRQEVQAYAQEPGANLRHAWNEHRQY